jgi:hypothetical protein
MTATPCARLVAASVWVLLAACAQERSSAAKPQPTGDAAVPAPDDSGLNDSGPSRSPFDAGKPFDAGPDAALDASLQCDKEPFPFQPEDEEVFQVQRRSLEEQCRTFCPQASSYDDWLCESDTDGGSAVDLDGGLDRREEELFRIEGCGLVIIHQRHSYTHSFASFDASTGRLLGYAYKDDQPFGPIDCEVDGYISGEIRDDCEDPVWRRCIEPY